MASTVSQRRAGTVLPPPADDFSYSAVVSAKHTIKNGTTVCSLIVDSNDDMFILFLKIVLISCLGQFVDNCLCWFA
jgi:hypothetical protein